MNDDYEKKKKKMYWYMKTMFQECPEYKLMASRPKNKRGYVDI